MSWRITHIDVHGRRHRLRLTGCNNRMAMAWAEQLYGEAIYMAVVRVYAVEASH